MITGFGIPPAPAATPVSDAIPVTLDGSTTVGPLSGTSGGLFTGSVSVVSDVTWEETGAIDVAWDADNLRQGRDLDPTYTFVPTSGRLTIEYTGTMTGSVNAFGNAIPLSIPFSFTSSRTCLPDAAGDYGTCILATGQVPIFEPFPGPFGWSTVPLAPLVSMQFSSTVDIGDLQSQTRRTATSGGAHVTPPVYLTPRPDTQTDEITIGRPLAGQTVTFTVGAQSTSAVTNAQGVATGSIKLKQKPGTYPVLASWAGSDGRYAADEWTGAFKLNTR